MKTEMMSIFLTEEGLSAEALLRISGGREGHGVVCSVGFFDGVHRGHRCLLQQIQEESRRRGMEAVLLTFGRHPREVVQADYVPQLLTTTQEKLQLLAQAGTENVAVLDFTREMSMLTARQFMQQVLLPMGVKVLVMGYDHQFGHGGGDLSDYMEWGRELGIEVLRATELGGDHVSSSECRRRLMEGRVEEAARLLGYRYLLTGTVESGHRMGHSLGFPTANIHPQRGKVLPRGGVYAVWVTLPDGSRHAGMLNIGSRPTMQNGEEVSIEVNILDYEGNLYGETIQLEFVKRLRDERKFSSLHELQQQLAKDRACVIQQLL